MFPAGPPLCLSVSPVDFRAERRSAVAAEGHGLRRLPPVRFVGVPAHFATVQAVLPLRSPVGRIAPRRLASEIAPVTFPSRHPSASHSST
jgi:hypothetical protein